MYIRRKVFSIGIDEYGEERLFSTSEIVSEELYLGQKIFTRADNKIIKQLYRVTNGFKSMPNGVTSLEDAKALKDLSHWLSIKNHNTKNIILERPDIKKALDNLGLTTLTEGNQLERIKHKFYNDEVAKRADQIYRNGYQVSDQQMDKLNNRYGVLAHAFDNNKKDCIKSFKNLVYDKEGNFVKRDSLPLMRFARKKLGLSVIQPHGDNLKKLDAFTNRSNGGGNFGIISDAIDATNFDVPAEKAQLMRLLRGKTNGYVVTHRNYPKAITLHELSHDAINREPVRVKELAFRNSAINPVHHDIIKRIGEITDENLASAKALNVIKNDPSLEKSKKLLDNSLNTYFPTGIRSIMENIGSRMK